MSELDSIIQVTIRRDTASVETAAFNIPMILATFTNFSERSRTYTDIEGIVEDFSTASNVWKMANKLFSQVNGRPPSIVVGRRQVDTVQGNVISAVNGATYTLTVNDEDYSYTAIISDTAADIVEAIATAYSGSPISGIVLTDNLDGTFEIGVSVAGTAWSVKSSANIALVNDTPAETLVQALALVKQENDVWYALTCESHLEADILSLAEAVEADKKIYGTSTAVAGAIASSTTDVAALLAGLNYSRTFITYLPTADTEYPECAWIGSQLPQVTGSNDWDFKSATGVTVSNLTSTNRVNLRDKNTNMYTRVAGQNIFQDGNMSDGRPIYEIIIKDWIEARMKEQIFFRLVNTLKIPYTRPGFAVIESEMRSVLSQGVANNALDFFTVTSPDPYTVPDNLRSQGIAGTFTFTARYSGSVRTVIINGNLTI